jgi:uncharacterized protein (DUF362 family)
MKRILIIKKKNRILIFLGLIAAGTICWDIGTSLKYAVEPGTYRYESDFDSVFADTTQVAIVPSDFSGLADPVSRTVDPGYSQMEGMVRKAIELQGGLNGIVEPGNKVLLKVNLVGANSPSGQGENTDVRVVKSVIKILDEFTVGDIEIVVAEGSARSNDVVDAAGSVWDNSGYQDLLDDPYLSGINFRLFNLNQTYDQLTEVNLGSKATAAPHNGSYHVHQEELAADVYISIPVLKIHDTGITCALKNQIGTAPGVYYGYNKMNGSEYYSGLVHDDGHRRWTTEEIVDLCTIADVDFVVVDAIMCLEKYKTYDGTNQVRFNTIVAGADPVAIDNVCARLFCLNPDDIAHITLAEKMGLGTNDPHKITLVGATIDEVKKQVKKNTSENGKFGQSNRTWLLSEPFVSTDMASEQIPGEANYEPVAGENGWTEPVYFFDDRIDLLSFYNGIEGMISYSFSYFYSPADLDAELWIGTEEAIKVYVNGSDVYSFSSTNTYGDDKIFTHIEPILIKTGENTLMVKTLNEFSDYSFALNICEVESNSNYQGNRIDGLKFYTTKDTAGGGDEPEPVRVNDFTGNDFTFLCYPNPFTEKEYIAFELPAESRVWIDIYDMKGCHVVTLADNIFTTGKHQIVWNISDMHGKVSRGVYVCTLRGENTPAVSQHIILK